MVLVRLGDALVGSWIPSNLDLPNHSHSTIPAEISATRSCALDVQVVAISSDYGCRAY